MSGKAKVTMIWVGAELPPVSQFVEIMSHTAGTGTFNGVASSASNGLGSPPASTVTDLVNSTSSYGKVHRKMYVSNGKIVFEVSLASMGKAIGTGRSTSGVGGFIEVVPIDRSMSIVFGSSANFRRGPHGVPVNNFEPNVMIQRADIGLSSLNKSSAAPGSGTVQLSFQRLLEGTWSRLSSGVPDPAKIFNEWWEDFWGGYFCDGLIAEFFALEIHAMIGTLVLNTQGVNVPIGRGHVEDMVRSPHVTNVRCRVTDSDPDYAFLGPCESIIRVHIQLPYVDSGEIWQAQKTNANLANETTGLYSEFPLGHVDNATDSPAQLEISVERESSATTTDSLTAGISIPLGPPSAIVNFGMQRTIESRHRWMIGSTLTVPVDPQSRVTVYAFPLGSIKYPLIAAYGPTGFSGDQNGFVILR